ncbi:MAG: hypothetical protein GX538_06330 [Gammaproteobacteria bacterium]|nr:hypothetical protein [Gammaproteobacteria bacterium]
MNQRLQNSKLAGAVTAMALAAALLLAEPVPRDPAVPTGAAAALAAGGHAAGQLGRGLVRDLEADAGRFDAHMTRSGASEDALAMASGLLAAAIVDGTLEALLGEFQLKAGPHPASPAGQAPGPRAARSRQAMAMPYFQTAGSQARSIGE